MNPHFRELNGLIEKKIDLYDKFIALLEKQWNSITEYSLGSLQEIILKKEALVQQMQGLEKQRSGLMRKIEIAMESPPASLTLKKIMESTSDPIRFKLGKNREILLAKIGAINQLHERLKSLMDHSSLSMKKSLVFVHSKGEEASSPYHQDGKLEEGNLQGRMLSLDA